MWIALFISPLIIVYGGGSGGVLLSLGTFAALLLGLLFVCLVVTGGILPAVRYVNPQRWSAPGLRLDRFPNLFALLNIPVESCLLIVLALAVFNRTPSK